MFSSNYQRQMNVLGSGIRKRFNSDISETISYQKNFNISIFKNVSQFVWNPMPIYRDISNTKMSASLEIGRASCRERV